MNSVTIIAIFVIGTLVTVEVIREPKLIAQILFQIALTIAITVNGLAILAKLDEIEKEN